MRFKPSSPGVVVERCNECTTRTYLQIIWSKQFNTGTVFLIALSMKSESITIALLVYDKKTKAPRGLRVLAL